MIRLGIDTGGTYTDAVIVELRDGASNDGACSDGTCSDGGVRVLASAKALTTKEDLTRGIKAAITALPGDALSQVEHAALSTTLATNACVEGKGGRARLIIVGTTDEILHRVDAQGKFGIPYDDVLAVEFVGSYDGIDVVIPDWEALYEANREFFDEAESFGIASLYSLNNGGVVERSGAAFLREKLGKLVVEAMTVAVEPNVIARGATALLNARLVPIIDGFLDAIGEVLADLGLDVPVSIVRSDGTLMSEELARTRPVETILSGPAASVAGAQALAGAAESLVVDIGGTTSDISIVHGGLANRTDGISIGGWKTQVAGVLIDTIALGGDTVVRFTKNSRLELGTRRVMPLCMAAARWPVVNDALERYLAEVRIDFQSRYELLFLLRDPGDVMRLSEPERRLVDLLRAGPLPLFDERMDIVGLKLQRLEDEGIVMRCGFTPTDAMHLKGDFTEFDAQASRLGARCLLKSYCGSAAAEDDEQIAAFADEVYELAQYRLFSQVVGAFAQDCLWPEASSALDAQLSAIARDVWENRRDEASDCMAAGECDESHPRGSVQTDKRFGARFFGVKFETSAMLVGVGAPTHVLLDEVGHALGAATVVPDHAEVANAVGAATARVVVEQEVHVHPLRGSDGVVTGYQVRAAGISEVFDDVDDALELAQACARDQAIEEAHRRGAGDVECVIDVECQSYEATSLVKIVRDWIVTARIG